MRAIDSESEFEKTRKWEKKYFSPASWCKPCAIIEPELLKHLNNIQFILSISTNILP